MEVIGQLHALAALSQRKSPPVPVGYEAGWAIRTPSSRVQTSFWVGCVFVLSCTDKGPTARVCLSTDLGNLHSRWEACREVGSCARKDRHMKLTKWFSEAWFITPHLYWTASVVRDVFFIHDVSGVHCTPFFRWFVAIIVTVSLGDFVFQISGTVWTESDTILRMLTFCCDHLTTGPSCFRPLPFIWKRSSRNLSL